MLTSGSEDWQTPETDELLDAIVDLPDRDEAARFLRDLCTLGELHDLGQRWQVVRLLAEGRHYADVSHVTGASTATVTRIAQWLRHGTGGYGRALERRGRRTGQPQEPPEPGGAAAGATTATAAAGGAIRR
ncbi:MAG TPA: YerC/YecD family TrpR-related protein [Candidatus Acidoferrales bacterium]|nr:YerC/YecD family TrpR-related protein [Candidatus Acidoferrales bacterium]